MSYTVEVLGVDVDPVLLASEIEAEFSVSDVTVTTVGDDRGCRLGIPPAGLTPPQVSRLSAVVAAHRTGRQRQLEQLRVKARAVWAGDDTFSQQQAQKILAGLVLNELGDR